MLIVKKFGGSSVANKERIFNVAKRCIEDYRAGHDVVVVLSAMGDTTDDLIALANTINPNEAVLIQQLLRWQLCYMPINVKSIQT